MSAMLTQDISNGTHEIHEVVVYKIIIIIFF